MRMRAGFAGLLALLAWSTPARPETIALTNARLHDGTGRPVVEGATIVMRNGRIVEAGATVRPPAGARIVELGGRDVTPGLFDSFGSLGVEEVDLEAGADDHEIASDELSSAVRIIDAFNPRSIVAEVNRAEGVSYAVIAPASATYVTKKGQVVPGRVAVVALHDPAGVARRPDAGLVFVFGQDGADLSGGSRAVALAKLRDLLDEARLYRREPTRPFYRRPAADLEAVGGVLDRRTAILALANRAADIEKLLELGRDYRVRLVIVGGAEAWLVASALAAADVPVILDPTLNLPATFDTVNARSDAATILHKAGVRLAIAFPDWKNARNARQSAGWAVAQGLPHEAGIAAITGNPAAIFGLDHTIGTLKAGADADLIVWDGDPLEVTAFPTRIFSRGREASLVSRQTLLRERYRRPETQGN